MSTNKCTLKTLERQNMTTARYKGSIKRQKMKDVGMPKSARKITSKSH